MNTPNLPSAFIERYTWTVWLFGLLTLLYCYQNIQRGLFADGVTGFSTFSHYFDGVLHTVLIPCLVFLAGFIHTKLVLFYKQAHTHFKGTAFIVNHLVYAFFLWSIIQGVTEIVFSGYTGGKDTVLTLIDSITYAPISHLEVWVAVFICAFGAHLLFRFKSKYAQPIILGLLISTVYVSNKYVLGFPFNLFISEIFFYALGLNLGVFRLRFNFVQLCAALIVVPFSFYHCFNQPEFDVYGSSWVNLWLALIGGWLLVQVFLFIRCRTQLWHVKVIAVIFLSHVLFGFGAREVLQNTFGFTSAWGLLFSCMAFAIAMPILVHFICARFLRGIDLTIPRFLYWQTLRYALANFLNQSVWIKYPAIVVSFLIFALCSYVLIGSQRIILKNTEHVVPESILEIKQDYVEEGKRLAHVLGCAGGCHGQNMQGEVFSRDLLKGTLTSKNLTRAIDEYSLEELDGIIRHGIHPDGSAILKGMPSAGFHALTDLQLSQILSYIAFAPKHHNQPPKPKVGVATRIAILSGEYQTEFAHTVQAHDTFNHVDTSQGLQLARIACTECHGLTLNGNADIGSPPLAMVAAYSYEQFDRLLTTGVALGERELGLMRVVALNRFSYLNEQEKRALYNALQHLATHPISESTQ